MSLRPTIRRALICCVSAAVLLVPAAGSAHAAPAYLGVQVHPLWTADTPADVSREVSMLADLGANVARIDVGWSSLQDAGPGSWSAWYVAKLDAFVAAASAHHIKVIATLVESPCWASSAPSSLKQGCAGSWWQRGVQDYAPSNRAAYGRAARFLTGRYGTKLAALEIWNEPNLAANFLGPNKAASYAALVRAAYPMAKAGNRHVPVLAGATAYSDTAFLAQLYAAGIKGFYDGISIHPYSDGRKPTSTSAPARLEFGAGIRAMRAAQVAAGQIKPLWLTEFGYTACDVAPCVTPAAQAQLIAQSVRTLPQFPFVRGATLYQLRDMTDVPGSWEDNFGLVHRDFTRRPAYAAFKAALAGLRRSSASRR
jgi:hypothetical protein